MATLRPTPTQMAPLFNLYLAIFLIQSMLATALIGNTLQQFTNNRDHLPTVNHQLQQKIATKINHSLDQVQRTNQLQPGTLTTVHKLLVRQLTSLIMNNHPEAIALNLQDSTLRDQVVDATSSDHQQYAYNSEIHLTPYGPSLRDSSEPDIDGPSQDIDLEATQSSPSSITENANQDETYVTCAPYYEDQTESNATSNESQSSNSSDEQAQHSLVQCSPPGSKMIAVITKVITPVLFTIIIIVGLLGNIIVMLIILEDRKTERELTPTNLLILDLSLADLSFILFCIPFTAWDYSVGHWVFGQLWCKFNQYLIVVCAQSSIYTLVLMSIDRFMAIVYPIECISYRTSRNTLYAIYIKWILILILALPTIPRHGLTDSAFGPNQFTCRFLSDFYNPLNFQITFFVTSYLFPLVLIFVLYLSLLIKLWYGSRPHGHKESAKMLESKKRVTWLVAGIVIVFALCWFPIQVMLILMRLKSHPITVTYVAVQVFAHTLGYMNSCINPIVYAFASETFHTSFKRSSMGRFCYRCLGIKQQEPERSSNFRTIQTNISSLNHTISQHHITNRTINNISPQNYSSNINNLSTTTLIITPECDQKDKDNIAKPSSDSVDKKMPDSICQLNPQIGDIEPDKTSIQCHANSDSPIGLIQRPAKQQLVAQVMSSSSNQVSHRCQIMTGDT